MPAPRFPIILWLALGASALAAAVAAQPTATWVSLDDRRGAPDFPFGLNVSPDGRFFHVAVAGTFSSNNNQLAVVDRATASVLARHVVGRFPEEIAYHVIPGTPATPPIADRIFVTNSSDSTVSVLDRNGRTLKTIPLGRLNYPFGIAMDPAGRQLAVTTKNHRVFLLDAALLAVTRTISLAGYHGRVAFLADGRMAFGSAVPVSGKTRVTATFLDPARPQAAKRVELVPPAAGYPSSEDVAVVADGREVWFPILGADTTIRRLDPRTGAQVGTLALASYFPGGGRLHGLGASGEGLALVTSVGRGHNTILLLQVSPPQVLSSVILPVGQQPNDVVFTPDGREACVTMQYGQPGVHLIRGLPVPAFRLLSDTLTPARGGSFTLTLRGAEGFSRSVVGLSITGRGPTRILGYTFRLSAPIVPLWTGPHDVRGRARVPAFPVPGDVHLKGLRVHLQAFVQEKGLRFRVSNPLTLVIQ